MKYATFNEKMEINGFYDSIVNKGKIPKEAVELSDKNYQFCMSSGGRSIIIDTDAGTVKPKPETEEEKEQKEKNKLQAEIDKIRKISYKKKLEGIEFDGVMCSVTKEDMWGIGFIAPLVKMGETIKFHFENGNKLELTPKNIEKFLGVFVPFTQKFFN